MPLTDYAWPTSITADVTTGEIADTLAAYDRLRKIILGWGHRGPVVAPSTTAAALKETADFVCTGTADQVKVDDALATGRPVLMLPGDLYFNAPLAYAATDGKWLRGCGRGSQAGATRINLVSGVNDYAIKFPSLGEPGMRGFRLENFSIQANGLNQTGGGGIDAQSAIECKFVDLHVNQPYDHGIRLGGISGGAPGHHNWVTDLWADSDNVTGVGGLGQAVHIQTSDENRIVGGNFQFMGGQSATGSYACQDWYGWNTWEGITIVGGLLTGTIFTGGLWIRDCNRVKVTGCNFDGVPGDNIFAMGGSHIITGSHFIGPGNATTPKSAIVLDNNTGLCQVRDNVLQANQTAGRTRSLIRETGVGSAPDNDYGPNTFDIPAGSNVTVAKIELAGGSLSRVADSYGMRTRNDGTATVASGSTSVNVTHGLDFTPALADISVTPTNNPTNAVRWWVSAVTSTTFTITVDTNPGASGATFAWQAKVR